MNSSPILLLLQPMYYLDQPANQGYREQKSISQTPFLCSGCSSPQTDLLFVSLSRKLHQRYDVIRSYFYATLQNIMPV